MQIKLNTIVAAAVLVCGGAAYAQDMVVKIGHVGPTSGGIAHLGKDNENGARMAIDEANAQGIMIEGKRLPSELAGLQGRALCGDEVDVRCDRVRTFARQREHGGATDPRAGARDDGYLSSDSRHVRLPPLQAIRRSTRLPPRSSRR